MDKYEERLDEITLEIDNIKRALKTAERKKANLKYKITYDEGAEQTYELYRSFVDAGFDEDKAFRLLITCLEKGLPNATR